MWRRPWCYFDYLTVVLTKDNNLTFAESFLRFFFIFTTMSDVSLQIVHYSQSNLDNGVMFDSETSDIVVSFYS